MVRPNNRAVFLAVCLLMVVGGASAFSWPWSKKAAAPVEEAAPAAEQPAAVGEEAALPPAAAQPSAYWYNDVSGASQWEEPKYEMVNEEGKTFYIDPDTKEASWEKPASLQWVATQDAEGKVFYYNEATTESRWEKPAVLAWRQIAVEEQKTEL